MSVGRGIITNKNNSMSLYSNNLVIAMFFLEKKI